MFHVSFIVPVFNNAKYLGECLDSIIHQSIDKEIIIVDDGSADESLSIALAYAKQYPFICVMHHAKNKGVSYARNQALNIAWGQYICFVDSDDRIEGDYFGQMLDLANQHQADLIRYQVKRFSTQLARLIPNPFFDVNNPTFYTMLGTDCFKRLSREAWIPGICWTLMKRELINTHQLRFLEDSAIEDQLFYIQLLLCQHDVKVLECPYVIYYYRTHESNTTVLPSIRYFLDHFYVINKLDELKGQHLHDQDLQDGFSIVQYRLSETALRIYQQFDTQIQTQLVDKAKHAQDIMKGCQQMLAGG